MLVSTIGAWNVLSIFPQTEEIARAMLASSAVIALIAGLALSTPLGNLGAGVLVAFTQPVRIGDRVTIGEHTGFVEQINMIYTVLVTDDERRVFVPNTQLASTCGREPDDPRPAPDRDGEPPRPARRPLGDARATVLRAIDAVEGLHRQGAKVLVGDVTGNVVLLTVSASAPLDADVTQLGSDVREAALRALAEAGHLAA